MMQLLWVIILVAFAISLLSIVRSFIFAKWRLKFPLESAMEFASFSGKPHPVHGAPYLIWISAGSFTLSIVAYRAIENITPSLVLLLLGMILYFIYDFGGSAERTNITILPDGIYFESAKGAKRPFLIPFANLASIEEKPNGFIIILKPNKFINRLPIKSSKSKEILGEVKRYFK